jgi:hypothetical protein
MCPTKPYGSIGMSSRWSQKMFYQGKFKSLHHVKRLGKMKIWIPLERRTRVESKELEGESEEGPWEILLLPILSLSLGWIFTTSWVERGEREKKGEEMVYTVWKGWMLVNNGGERRERGKREDIFTVGPWVEVGCHRSDQWWAPVRPVTTPGQVSEPLSVFPTLPR